MILGGEVENKWYVNKYIQSVSLKIWYGQEVKPYICYNTVIKTVNYIKSASVIWTKWNSYISYQQSHCWYVCVVFCAMCNVVQLNHHLVMRIMSITWRMTIFANMSIRWWMIFPITFIWNTNITIWWEEVWMPINRWGLRCFTIQVWTICPELNVVLWKTRWVINVLYNEILKCVKTYP